MFCEYCGQDGNVIISFDVEESKQIIRCAYCHSVLNEKHE